VSYHESATTATQQTQLSCSRKVSGQPGCRRMSRVAVPYPAIPHRTTAQRKYTLAEPPPLSPPMMPISRKISILEHRGSVLYCQREVRSPWIIIASRLLLSHAGSPPALLVSRKRNLSPAKHSARPQAQPNGGNSGGEGPYTHSLSVASKSVLYATLQPGRYGV
jgi:hypothetical protein